MKVKFQLAQPLDIGNDGVELSLHSTNGALFGKLTIGRATVKWRKRSARKDAEIKTEELIKLIEQHLADEVKRSVTPIRHRASQRSTPVNAQPQALRVSGS